MTNHSSVNQQLQIFTFEYTLRYTKIAMKNRPLEDVFPMKNGDIPAS